MILAIARQKAHDRGIRADSPLLTRSISEPRVARCKNSKIDFGCNLAPGLSNQDKEEATMLPPLDARQSLRNYAKLAAILVQIPGGR